MARQTKTISICLTPDTLERLDQYAYENHCSRSAAITMLTWAAKVKNSNIRGQQNLNDMLNK